MSYIILAVLIIGGIIFLSALKKRRNKGTGHNAKDGAGYPNFDTSSGNYHDGGPGGSPK